MHISRLTAMGEMASALAHELNQPLSAIANYLKGAAPAAGEQHRCNAAVMRDAMDKARRTGPARRQIIRRLRDFVARGESERRVESISKLIEEASALALVGAKEHGVRVRFQLDPQRRHRAGRQGADPAGAAQPDPQCDRGDDETERRELVVVHGAGGRRHGAWSPSPTPARVLPPEIAFAAFQPFVTTKVQGMGVGLSISRTIIDGHGGQLWVEPTPGGGAPSASPCAR